MSKKEPKPSKQIAAWDPKTKTLRMLTDKDGKALDKGKDKK